MRKIIFYTCFLVFSTLAVKSQTLSIKVVQTSFNATDPDGVGPATGTATYQFELMASTPLIQLEGIGLSNVYQTAGLMLTPTTNATPLGPLATAVSSGGWTKQLENRTGTTVNVTYGGTTYDKRTYFQFSYDPFAPVTVDIPNTWTPIMSISYYTLGSTAPQGGNINTEPGSIYPQNQSSGDAGGSEYLYLSPGLLTAVPLGSPIVTPVLFTIYNVTCTDKGASLTWSTASEQNSSKFEIQRSVNSTDWITIDNVAAAGNSDVQRNYQYLDLNSGTAFYRIRQVDNDGRYVYTAVKRTDCKTSQFDITLYPVPAKDNLNVVIKAEKALKTDLQILDVNGRIVQRINTQINKGNNNIVLNVSGLPAGQYLLSGSDPSVLINKKFTIIR